MFAGLVGLLLGIASLWLIEYATPAPDAATLVYRQWYLLGCTAGLFILSVSTLVYGITWWQQWRRYHDEK